MERKNPKRQITFRIDQNKFKQIEELVSQGQVDSITNFITKCIELGLQYSLHTWNRGIWFVHGNRVGGLSKQNFATICANLEDGIINEIGKKVGEQFSVYIKILSEIESTNRKNWFQALRDIQWLNGWGNYLLKGNAVTIMSPLPPAKFMKGFLEGFLGAKLKMLSEEPLRFEIHEK